MRFQIVALNELFSAIAAFVWLIKRMNSPTNYIVSMSLKSLCNIIKTYT